MSHPTFDQYLMADHRACDEHLGALRRHANAGDWGAAQQAFATLQHDLLAHFAAEEEILFPAFETRTGMRNGPTRVMRMEHEEVRFLLEDLTEALSTQDAEAIRGHGEALLILLQQHNMKEENILYPASRDAVGGDLASLSEQIIQRREAA
ncbi:hemerythrin domain-containing protein [Uliginosibacterium gangwonense]|uniref:hemerythrin domain-containing protein n=1 Tax=Uliginosibacterium gangwonense TaxID=392736 RepID=UPI0003600248|nr:hemerythrin domain-containing protein [Uliginosibacterium gangwonense]